MSFILSHFRFTILYSTFLSSGTFYLFFTFSILIHFLFQSPSNRTGWLVASNWTSCSEKFSSVPQTNNVCIGNWRKQRQCSAHPKIVCRLSVVGDPGPFITSSHSWESGDNALNVVCCACDIRLFFSQHFQFFVCSLIILSSRSLQLNAGRLFSASGSGMEVRLRVRQIKTCEVACLLCSWKTKSR